MRVKYTLEGRGNVSQQGGDSFNAVTPRPSLARMTKDALIVYARQFDLELDPQLLKSDLIEQIENTYATQ